MGTSPTIEIITINSHLNQTLFDYYLPSQNFGTYYRFIYVSIDLYSMDVEYGCTVYRATLSQNNIPFPNSLNFKIR